MSAYGKVREPLRLELVTHGHEGVVELEQMTDPQLEHMLVRLVDRPYRVIDVRRAGLLDMSAEDMGDGAIPGEVDQSLVAGLEHVRVAVDVDTAWVE